VDPAELFADVRERFGRRAVEQGRTLSAPPLEAPGWLPTGCVSSRRWETWSDNALATGAGDVTLVSRRLATAS